VRITAEVDSFLTQITLPDEAQTLALGAALAARLTAGDCLALRGGLGVGKTTLARGLITALSGETDVPSPTYTLVQSYDTPKGELWHGDMYRLERPEDCLELGLEDAFLDAICLIEWPDKLGAFLPETAINLTIEFADEGRVARLEGAQHWIKDFSL
jgi:tRNA threonylcarbamoyladenosine biosynthesis protein TsaE